MSQQIREGLIELLRRNPQASRLSVCVSWVGDQGPTQIEVSQDDVVPTPRGIDDSCGIATN